MARRRPTRINAGYEPQDLHWRLQWLQRSTLMSDERVRDLVSNESKRLAPLPIDEQVRRMEAFLDRHGLLDRAERLINRLIDSRVRWREQIRSKGTTK